MKKKEKHSGRSYLRMIGAAICLVVFLFALYNIVTIIQNYKKIDNTYDGAAKEFT